MTTFGRYATATPIEGGRQLVHALQVDQDPEAASNFLATASVLCAAPHLEALAEDRAAVSLLITAHPARVPTSLD